MKSYKEWLFGYSIFSHGFVLMVFGVLLVLFVISPVGRAKVSLEGTWTSSLSTATSDCRVESGSVVCTGTAKGNDTSPYFFESLLDLKVSRLLGHRDKLRSISQFYHPYTPYSGLAFQAFTARTLIGEIASLEGTAIFSPNIIIYTTPDRRTEWYGEDFSRLAFRRLKSTLEFELVGTTARSTLILDDWKDEMDGNPNTNYGLMFEVSGQTENEVNVKGEARLGVKKGATCFGNCLGPLKLQRQAVQDNFIFEEFLISAKNFSFGEVNLNLSSKFTSDHGFNHLSLSGTRTWPLNGSRVKLSSSWIVTSNTLRPFAGTSLAWTSEPLSLSLHFDETFKLKKTQQILQFNPDLSELDIDGLNLGSNAFLGKRITLKLSVPTDPVEFSSALRFSNENGKYNLSSGILRAELEGDPFGVDFSLAFREGSRIIKIETELAF